MNWLLSRAGALALAVAATVADLLHAAMIVYLPPLVAAAIAAGLTSVFTQRDIDTAAAALLGLAVGLFAAAMSSIDSGDSSVLVFSFAMAKAAFQHKIP